MEFEKYIKAWIMAIISAASLLVPLLAILVSPLCGHSISPGKYCRLPDLDCMLITVAEGVTTTVEYHHHSIETESHLSPNGELTNFEVRWDRYRHTHGFLRARVSSLFTALNESHLAEAFGDSEFIWERVDDLDTKQKLVEIAVLTKKARNETIVHKDAFIHHAFSKNATPPVYYWDGVYGIGGCPTTGVKHLDKDHSASKVIGIVLAHYRIWQEFYRRHKDSDPESRILILEADIRYSRKFCGDIAIEHINRTDKDLLFIGWCRAPDSDINDPPVCAHAYAISAEAAQILLTNVFPCVNPVDDQIVDLCMEGKLTWATVTVDDIHSTQTASFQTSGLIRQVGW